MGDSLMVMIAIFVAAILMFIFPLLSLSERNDDISQTVVQTATSEFVDKVSIAGKIKPSEIFKPSDMGKFIEDIKETYDIIVKLLDDFEEY